MQHRDIFLARTLDLARLGAGRVSPNPLVGSILTRNGKILAEGYHKWYGQPHAEVNCLEQARQRHQTLDGSEILYVSLEPCCTFGNTPPCTELILSSGIKFVHYAETDPTPEVNGKSRQILEAGGRTVVSGTLAQQAAWLNRFRDTFLREKRPYILLKFACSADGFLSRPGERTQISNPYMMRLVHKLRAEYDAILVGTNTVRVDKPLLTNRYYPGKSPLRIIPDRDAILPWDLVHPQGTGNTLWVTREPLAQPLPGGVEQIVNRFGTHFLPDLLHTLYEKRINSLIVEGGRQMLQTFLQADTWDEMLVLESPTRLGKGVRAPEPRGSFSGAWNFGGNRICRYLRHALT